MPGPRIDLHTHTTASDGTTPPEELVRAASDAGLDAVAVTDHDTIDGWDRAADALPAGLSLVRGAELSCSRDGISLHLLAYLFDPSYPPLAERMDALRESRIARAEQIVRLLVADGVPVSWEQVRELADGTVGRPHIAQALVGSGVLATVADAFTPEWIGTGGRYWGSMLEVDVLDMIELVRQAGGVSVFAHPGAAARGRVVGEQVIAEMAAAGLTGLEVDHPDHLPATSARLRRLAGALELVPTGASDFHGRNKTVALGAHLTTAAAYEELLTGASGLAVL